MNYDTTQYSFHTFTFYSMIHDLKVTKNKAQQQIQPKQEAQPRNALVSVVVHAKQLVSKCVFSSAFPSKVSENSAPHTGQATLLEGNNTTLDLSPAR
jgi:hypothetical protein